MTGVAPDGSRPITAELVAVLVAVTGDEPRVLATRHARALPAGPFQPSHRSLQAGLRAWVEQQTHHPLGYVEQLYTFADRDRVDAAGAQTMSISYLGLTREGEAADDTDARWQSWYRYFPWEDQRIGPPALIAGALEPALRDWAAAVASAGEREARQTRVDIMFGLGGHAWNEDLVLQRYELLYEAALVPEACVEGHAAPALPDAAVGTAMAHDHRRILATGVARLRAKIKYRPVVFELMPPAFTLLQLQQAVEAIAGQRLHKQNFRRVIEQQELVEETGEVQAGGAGRPAKLVRFRRGVLQERAISGSKLPFARLV
ncbi:hypothetical protein IMZ29_09095 [Achromobacter sp. GG226]|uniref:NUDIX hydrolase n=1 Tax=Verticiella alkaliphila TaxID=2779529 RepID=UPI001C0CF7B8|nr:hypothetical protein [Verticiella sp. GG226]MBU4610683.1 hypothetical protein [Verticiella sp. GG226]